MKSLKNLLLGLIILFSFGFSPESASVDKITIARSSLLKKATSVKMGLQSFSPESNADVKIGIIKWEINYYAEVLSNPHIEGLSPFLTENYTQIIRIRPEAGGMATVTIILLANSGNIPSYPTFFHSIGKIVFDRVPNANPVSWGLKVTSFLCEVDSEAYQMFL